MAERFIALSAKNLQYLINVVIIQLLKIVMQKRNYNCNCAVCNKPLYKRPCLLKKDGVAFCSQACYGLSCRKSAPCVICGVDVLASKHSKTCSKECSGAYNKSLMRSHSLGRKKIEGASKYGSRSFRKYFLELRGSTCQVCDYKKEKVLQIHHIVERAKGGNDELENLVLLCPNCHREIHAGLLKLFWRDGEMVATQVC